MNNIFDRLTFQRFVADNFDKVISILNNGVHYVDENLFINVVRQSDHKNTVMNNRGYVGVIHEEKEKFLICVAAGSMEKLRPLAKGYTSKIVNSTYCLFSYLKKDKVFNDDNDGSPVYRYTYTDFHGKEKKIYSKMVPCDKWVRGKKMKSEESFYSSDFYFNFDIDSESEAVKANVWDSFFLLYAVMYNASKDVASKAAAIDFQDNVKIVCGMFANPLRFLLGQADQYQKYIFDAFDIEKDVRKVKAAQRIDDKKAKSDEEISYYDRVTHLQGTIPAGFYQLMHFYKNVRNLEGHNQVVMEKPVSLRENFLLYNVALVYILRYVLGHKPSKKLAESVSELRENLYFPVTFPDNIGISIEGSDVCALDGCHYFVPAFREFSIKGGDRHEHYTINDLNTTGLIINRDLEIRNSAVLAAIDRIEYNPVLESIQKQLADLRNSSVPKEEVEKMIRKELEAFLNGLNKNFVQKNELESNYMTKKEFDEVKNNILDELPVLFNKLVDRIAGLEVRVTGQGEEIKGLKHKEKLKWLFIYAPIAAVSLLLLSVFVIANIRPWAIKNNGIYWLANKLCVFHDKGDISYDRAKYIESVISSNIVNDSIMNSHNYLRTKAFDAYSKAKRYYEGQLRNSGSNPKAAYRLALMYSLGKGGVYDEKKAAEYASEAVRNNYADKSRSLKEILMFFSTGDEIYLSGACLDKVSDKDEFAPLLREMVAIADMVKKPAIDSLMVHESMKKIQSIALGQSDAKETACILMADLLRGDIEAFGKIDKEPFLEILMLEYSAIMNNSVLAQAALGNIYEKMGLIPEAATMYMSAFYNGFDISGEQGLIMLTDHGVDIEKVYSEWPLIKEKFDNSELIVKNLSNAVILAKENKMKMFDAEMKKFTSDMESLGLPLVFKKGKYFEDFIYFNNPDSADLFLNNLDKMALSEKVQFLTDLDSLEKRTAVENYVMAVYELEGFGNKRIGEAKADSLLRESATIGFVPAIITFANRLYNLDMYHYLAPNAIDWMRLAAPYSDDACIWLSERYRYSNSDLSMKYVDMIQDSLNQYKLMRRLDDIYTMEMLQLPNRKFLKDDYDRHMKLLKQSIDLHEIQNPKLLGSMMAYLAEDLFRSSNKWSNDNINMLMIALSSSLFLNPESGLIFRVLNRLRNEAYEKRDDRMIKKLNDFYISSMDFLKSTGIYDAMPMIFKDCYEFSNFYSVSDLTFNDLTWVDLGYLILPFTFPSEFYENED